ncbi:MAG: hypothetical protein EA425_13305 [Puniceicoccaceae bacterium]|nr:MAG: hypothetical protein EA425_13305 [Puniceicoccaceae bacterium]
MPAENKTFSEMWYRVAGLSVWLGPQVRVRRQHFRGDVWHLVEDPFNNSFYRLRPQAYDFVGRLRKGRSIEEVWSECLELDPDGAPGQDEVIQLLAQLHQANLLHGDLPPDHAKIFERYRKRKQRERRFIWKHLMFARFPLWDPDAFLVRTLPLVRWLARPWVILLWLGIVAFAAKGVLENTSGLGAQAMNLLAFENLLLLYAAIVVVKTLHEFGHAYTCRGLGGEVHTMGIMLLVLSPLPYMDATASWSFRERWKRIAVASAGMGVELVVAAFAALVWVAAGEGLARDLAFNIMLVASVSTLVFNANPLLRYDGYYILADLLDIPNLHSRGQKQVRHLAEHYLFGLKKSKSPANSAYEAGWLTAHGILAGIYRVVVFAGIIFFVSTQYLLLGLLMAVICLVSWLVVPAGKFAKYLADSPSLQRNRTRALLVTAGGAAVVFGLLAVLPFPQSMRAPGILRAAEFSEVVTEAEGRLVAQLTPGGTFVEAGTPLLRLENEDLHREIESVSARLRELEVRWRRALGEATPDLAAIEQSRLALEARRARLLSRAAALVVRAPVAGVWSFPQSEEMAGAWLARGARIGHVLSEGDFVFTAIVSQRTASRLFADETRAGRIRLAGQGGMPIPVGRVLFIQAEQDRLPSAALGVLGGGSVATAANDAEGVRTTEAFFEVRAFLPPEQDALLRHGLTGSLRFNLPPEPLTRQAGRRLRQLFQTHFSL